MHCEYCEMLERNENIIYQDADLVVAVKEFGLAEGQVTIFPKNHLTILELVDDHLLEKCSALANKVGMAVFDSLGAQGTNVIINNGLGAGQKVPHFALEVIPRAREDGLNLQWSPQPANEEEISTTFSLLKEELEALKKMLAKNKELHEEKQHLEKNTIAEKADSEPIDGKNNHMIKALRRIP